MIRGSLNPMYTTHEYGTIKPPNDRNKDLEAWADEISLILWKLEHKVWEQSKKEENVLSVVDTKKMDEERKEAFEKKLKPFKSTQECPKCGAVEIERKYKERHKLEIFCSITRPHIACECVGCGYKWQERTKDEIVGSNIPHIFNVTLHTCSIADEKKVVEAIKEATQKATTMGVGAL